jgi:hypothetical protein
VERCLNTEGIELGHKHVQLGRELAEKYKMLWIVDASPSSTHLCTKLGLKEEDIVTIDLSHCGKRRNIYFQSYVLQARSLEFDLELLLRHRTYM